MLSAIDNTFTGSRGFCLHQWVAFWIWRPLNLIAVITLTWGILIITRYGLGAWRWYVIWRPDFFNQKYFIHVVRWLYKQTSATGILLTGCFSAFFEICALANAFGEINFTFCVSIFIAGSGLLQAEDLTFGTKRQMYLVRECSTWSSFHSIAYLCGRTSGEADYI